MGYGLEPELGIATSLVERLSFTLQRRYPFFKFCLIEQVGVAG